MATITVGASGDFLTIQAAIDAAAAGDTIVVEAGVYAEQLVINKAVTLQGANMGLDGDDAGRGAESMIQGTITLGADGVTIDGFAIQNASSAIRGGANGSVNYSDITIANSVFDGLTTNANQYIVNGFGLGGAPAGGSNWTISGNLFDGFAGNDQSAIRIDNVDGLQIIDNVMMHDNGAVTGRRGIQVDNSQNVTISDNVVDLGVTDFTNPNAAFTAARYAVQLSLDADGSSASTSNVVISGNTFRGAYDGVITGDDRNLTGLDITGNTFEGFVFGVRLSAFNGGATQGTQSDIEVSGNTFTVERAAVAFSHNAPTEAFADVVVQNNTITNGADGIEHLTSQNLVLSGTNVFEGSAADEAIFGGTGSDTIDGGAGADTINAGAGNDTIVFDAADTVDGGDGIDTFLVADADEAALAAASGATGMELITNGAGTFFVLEGMSIQAAVNAAQAGDTIVVAAGAYAETVTVGKALTILGANDDTVAHAGGGLNGARGAESVLTGTFILNADGISISGFEVTGGADAFRVMSGGQALDNISLSNNYIHDTTDSPIRAGLGFGGGIGSENWSITGNFIDDINGNARTGMVLFNIEGLTVTDNVISHDDAGFTGRRGINLDGIIDGDISGNTINLGVTDLSNESTANTASPWGIQISMSNREAQNVSVDGNTVTGSRYGIITLNNNGNSNVSIVNNFISDTYHGIGLQVGSAVGTGVVTDMTVTGNTIDSAFSGIRFGSTVAGGSDDAYSDLLVQDNTITVSNPAGFGVWMPAAHNTTTTGTGASINGSDSADLMSIVNGSGTDTLNGLGGDDTLIGGSGDDTLDGGAGADNMQGGAGNDTFLADADDTLDGGDGTDTAIVADAATAAAVAANATGLELITDGAGTFYVFEGMSIQAAIDAADAGDTIILGAGTYGENLIVNEGVTILGANAGVAGNGTRGAESVLTGQITVNSASAATIDGVSVTHDGVPAGAYNALSLVSAGHTVTNSTFLTTVPTGISETRAIFMGPQASGSFTISDNFISGVFSGSGMFGGANQASWNRGIWSDGGGVTLNITGNVLDHVRSGMNLDSFNSGVSNVSGNTFQNVGTGVSVGPVMDGPAITGIHGNTFTNAGTDFNLQNVPGAFTFDANATNNVATDVMVILGGTHADTITGTEGADYIDAESLNTDTANPDIDILYGLGGDDVLLGKDGDDVLNGGAGNDVLDGGLGFDTADYSDDADGIAVDLAAGTVTGGAGVGSDTLIGIEAVLGGSGNDTVIGAVGVDAMGFQVNAVLSSANFSLAADGSWTVTGDGTDNIDGGEVIYDSTGAAFLLVGGNSFASVQAALDSGIAGTLVIGTAPVAPAPVDFNFDATAGAPPVEIIGSDADDTLNISVVNADPDAEVTFTSSGGEIDADLTGNNVTDLTFSGVEDLVISGFSNVTLTGNFNDAGVSDNTIVYNGTAGNDSFDGSGETSGVSQEAYGFGGDDVLTTGFGDDIIDGGAGSDVIHAGGGNDHVIGNADGVSDSYNGGAGNDTIDYSADTDGFNINLTSAGASGTGIGNDTVAGFENVIGGSGSDGIIGNGADNRLVGGLGDDDIRGLLGIDTAVINADASNGIATQLSGGRLIVDTVDGSDVLRGIEFIEFNNATIAVTEATGNAHAWGGADTDEADEGDSGDGVAATGNVLTNDIEIEGEAITVTGVAAGAESANSGLTTGGVGGAVAGAFGSLTLNANGTYSYVVTNQSLGAGETAMDTFTYRVSDGEGGGDLTTITFTVSGENDAPVIVTADGDADVTESDMQVSDTGAIVFSDLDATDDLTVSDDSASTTITWDGGSLSMGQEAAIRAGFTLDETSFDNSGTVNWTYSASAADLDFLAAGETVTFDVTVTVTDDSGEGDNSVTSVVSVTITGTNDAPTVSAINGAATDEDDTSYELNLLTDAGAADVDQTDVLSVADVSAASSNLGRTVVFSINETTGAFSLNATQFDDLADGESETITVSYDVVDGNGGVTSNTATFVVNGVNDAPVVTPITAADITEDDSDPYSLDLLANASDADASDDLDVANVSAASSNLGRMVAFVVDEETGELTLDPDQFNDLAEGESETITVTYDVIDGEGGVTPTTATFVVNGVNDDPVAEDDSPFQMDEDTGGTIDTADLLANDTDDDTSDILTVTAVSATSAGGALLTLNGDGTITYDSNGQFDYLAFGESTTDTFTYTVDDGNGGTSEATVTVTVNGVNDAPVGAADDVSADENGPAATGNLLTNDTDADTSDVLEIASVNGSGANVGTEIILASGALLTVNADGSYSYDPNGQFEELADGETTTDSFEYDASDSNGGFTGAITVTITITGSNDGPTVGAAVTATVTEDDVGVSADLLDGAADVDNGAELSVVNDSVLQTGGTAFDLSGFTYDIDANGQLTFDPDQFDSLGEDDDIELTFSYDVTDENGATVAQTAVITIQGENDEPEFVDPDATPAAFDENDSLVASGAFDFDGTDRTDSHTATAVLDSASVSGGGSLTLAQQNALAAAMSAMVNGSSVEWDFDASAANFDSLNPGQNVTATYTVTVDDGEGGSDTRTVTVTINGDYENLTAPDGGGTVTGTNLDDNITGSDDDDTLIAGGGDNIVNGGGGDDGITSGSGDDQINGGGGDDTIVSGSGNDIIDGGAGDDNINAGSGDDLVFSSTGDDLLRGGSGTDTISFQNTAAAVTFNLAATGLQLTPDGNSLYQGFENVIGSAFHDTLTGDSRNNRLEGGDGNDSLNGGLGDDVLVGGAGNDTYFTDAGDTVIEQAGGGIDRIFTSAATYVVGNNIENLYGLSASGHHFTGDDGANILAGNSGNDTLIGGLGADTLIGQAGNDYLSGGTGAANTMIGGLGNDTYLLEANDTIVESAGQGHDTILTTRTSHTLNANVEDMSFVGVGSFTGVGNVLNNALTGGAGNDTLTGGAGNDTLNGGAGIDVARVSGLSSGYSVAREGAGWRVIDTFLGDGDDGSDFLVNMETLRFGNGETMSLVIEAPAPLLTADKGEFDGPQVLPGLADDDFVFSKFDDGPLVLPGSDGGFSEALFGSLQSTQSALPEPLLVREAVKDEYLPHDIGRHDDWMI